MNEDQARLERVLDGLREAEPADGLEQRVLRAVQKKAPGKSRPTPGLLWGILPVAPKWVAIPAAVVVLSVLGSIGWRHLVWRDRAGLARQAQPARVHGTVPAAIVAVQPHLPLPRRQAVAHRTKLASAGHPEGAPQIVALGNHPAPEQPLTDEERLLLRIAHRASPEEFEALNPDARDAQARADKAEFRKFFGPPPTGDSE